MAKDVGIASDIIARSGFDVPLTEALADYLNEALDRLKDSIGSVPDHTEIYRDITGSGAQKR